MIDFSILPTALLFIAKAIPNTLFMAFISLFFGIVLGSVVAVLREQGGRAVNGLFAVLVSSLRGVPAIVQLFIVYNSLPFLLDRVHHLHPVQYGLPVGKRAGRPQGRG